MNFTGKIAIVTGGGGGIGRATAVALARHGARVTVVDRDEAGGRETVSTIAERGGAASLAVADVASSSDVEAFVGSVLERDGRIDCFFNNAGIEGILAPIHQADEANFDRVIAVNLRGAFLGLRYVLAAMVRQGSGAIVSTSSVGGLAGAPNLAAYSASKHGVLGLTRTAAADVAPFGIRVNAVCPGPIDTRMIRAIDAQRRELGADVALAGVASLGTADDVANLVLFLLSDLARNITGAHFTTDGGRMALPGTSRYAPPEPRSD